MTDRLAAQTPEEIPIIPDISDELAATLDSLPVLVWVSGPDKGGIFFNRAWLEMTGRSLEQEAGEGWIEGVHPDDLPILQGCADAFAERRPFEIEFRLRRNDGAWRYLLDKAAPRFARNGAFLGFIGCCVDVTEKREAEAAIQANEHRISNILESISDGFFTINRDWQITYVNPKGGRMLAPLLGAPKDFLGKSIFEILPEMPGTPFFNVYRRAMQDQVPLNLEAFYAPLDSWFDVRCYPTAEGLAIHFLDIGPRKRAEQALRESEERFRTLADNLPLIVWVRDAESQLEFVNETFCNYFAVERDQVLAGHWHLASHSKNPGGYLEEFRTCVRERRQFHGEVQVHRGDGEWRWLESWARPRFGADGEYLGHIGTSADVTERKRADEVRKLLLRELNHRVKNTLAVVQAIAYQTFRSGRAPAEQRQLFESRLTALAGAHDALTDENWERAALAGLVAAAARTCGCDPGRLTARGPLVMLEPKQAISVALALHELCTNAIKYGALSNAEGHVSVEWSRSGDQPGAFDLVWTERGGPPVSPPLNEGFGTFLLKQALALELGAAVDLNYGPDGLTCTVTARGEAG